MAANDGWFAQWFAGGWFPAVWFAPADESHLLPEEIRTGGRRRPRILHLAPVAQPVFDARRNPVDEEAALLLCDAL